MLTASFDPATSQVTPRQYGPARHEGGEADGELEQCRNHVMLHQMLSSKGFSLRPCVAGCACWPSLPNGCVLPKDWVLFWGGRLFATHSAQMQTIFTAVAYMASFRCVSLFRAKNLRC